MPRPTTKTAILSESRKEYAALEQLLATLSPEEMTQPGLVGEWSAKDVLAHLTEWTQMVLGWHAAGLRGETPALPAPGYKWNQLPALNQHIYEKHRDEALADVLEGFQRPMARSWRWSRACPKRSCSRRVVMPGPRRSPGSVHRFLHQQPLCWARTELRKGLRAREDSLRRQTMNSEKLVDNRVRMP